MFLLHEKDISYGIVCVCVWVCMHKCKCIYPLVSLALQEKTFISLEAVTKMAQLMPTSCSALTQVSTNTCSGKAGARKKDSCSLAHPTAYYIYIYAVTILVDSELQAPYSFELWAIHTSKLCMWSYSPFLSVA